MHLPRGANALLTVMLLLLVAALGVLATLQYRWIDRASDAERQQMRANLDFAANRFIDGFESELQTAFDAFAGGEDEVPARYEAWKRRAAHPALLEAVYVIDGESLQKLQDGQLVSVEWPERFAWLHDRLTSFRGPVPGPFESEGLGLLVMPQRREPPGLFEEPMRLVLLQLNRAELTNVIFPDLVQRHFSGRADVAVVPLYRSNRAWPDATHAPDVDLPFVPLGPRRTLERPRRTPPPPPHVRDARPTPLRLLARRHDGGVDAAIATARTRNLALGFGVLVILVATIALLLALLRRADRLRAQQTEFVAAMSHELNTPVAALRSAGENLRDGIVVEREHVGRYGATIVAEASRLGAMLGQVLEYAGMQAKRSERPREAVDIGSVIEEAVAQSRWMVEGTPIHIATVIEGGLPPVLGDAKALTSAVQNLVANAIRYGGSGNWIGVRASANRNGIAITVEDRGPGIDGRDLPHLFEPFYRGREHGTTRGAGLGLSIVRRIVHDHGGSIDVERRARNEGAAFTIHLPVTHA